MAQPKKTIKLDALYKTPPIESLTEVTPLTVTPSVEDEAAASTPEPKVTPSSERVRISEREAALIIGWTPQTIKRWRELNRMPTHIRQGLGTRTRISYDLDEIIELAKTQTARARETNKDDQRGEKMRDHYVSKGLPVFTVYGKRTTGEDQGIEQVMGYIPGISDMVLSINLKRFGRKGWEKTRHEPYVPETKEEVT